MYVYKYPYIDFINTLSINIFINLICHLKHTIDSTQNLANRRYLEWSSPQFILNIIIDYKCSLKKTKFYNDNIFTALVSK